MRLRPPSPGKRTSWYRPPANSGAGDGPAGGPGDTRLGDVTAGVVKVGATGVAVHGDGAGGGTGGGATGMESGTGVELETGQGPAVRPPSPLGRRTAAQVSQKR